MGEDIVYGSPAELVLALRAPLSPSPIQDIQDIKKFPNDILMSYAVSEENLTRNDVAYLLKHPSKLENLLKNYVKTSPAVGLVSYSGTVYASSESLFLSRDIKRKTHLFAAGSQGSLLIAEKESRNHKYPSGRLESYFALTNELSANMSVFDCGFADYSEDEHEIGIRESFITTILALLDFVAGEYSVKDIESNFRGIVLAHELCEIQLFKKGNLPEKRHDLELETEKLERNFLEQEGVDLKYYELFHLLRSADHCEKRGKNISKLISSSLSYEP